MSSQASRSFSVGVVSLVALGIIVLGVLLVGREERFWEDRVDYVLQFSRANALQEGAPVLLDGVNVGSVGRMSFPPDPTARYIEVTISVSEHVVPRMRTDTVGRVQTLGLLGDKYIDLSSGTLEGEPLPPGGLIRSIDPVDYEAILGQSGDIVSNVIEVTALLRQVLTDITTGEGLLGQLISDKDYGRTLADDMSMTMANLESATGRIDYLLQQVESGEGALGTLLVDDQRMSDILDSLETASHNALEFSQRLTEGDGALARLATDDEFATETLGSLRQAATDLASVVEKVRSGEGTIGKLVYDPQLYNDAEALVGGRGGFFGMIMRFLWPFGDGSSGDVGRTHEDDPTGGRHRPQDRFPL